MGHIRPLFLQVDAILSVLFQNDISNLHIVTDKSDNHPDIQQMHRAVSAGLEGCLQSLTLRIWGLGVDGATLLARGLARSSSLTKLCISYSLIMEDGVLEPLATSGLRSNTSIEEFNFDRCHRPDSDNAKLIASLRLHPKLRSIRLDGKRCGSKSVMALASVLESTTCSFCYPCHVFQVLSRKDGQLVSTVYVFALFLLSSLLWDDASSLL
jgi:hypothetical protein